MRNRWGSKLINEGDITFYQFIVSFMGVYFSGQATALAFSFASSESRLKRRLDRVTNRFQVFPRQTRLPITTFGSMGSRGPSMRRTIIAKRDLSTGAVLTTCKTWSFRTHWRRITGFSRAYLCR